MLASKVYHYRCLLAAREKNKTIIKRWRTRQQPVQVAEVSITISGTWTSPERRADLLRGTGSAEAMS